MNSKTSSASTTRRNGYHKPVVAFVKKAYNQMAVLTGLKSSDQYYYGRLYHHHKGDHRE
jgi:hypothetical protein